MKIIEEIKKEHDQIRDYFLQMENHEEKAPEIFKELATFVLSHHEAEEHTVFKALSNKKDVKEIKNNLKAEHAALRRSIQVVLDTPEDDVMWEPNVHVFKDLLSHHVEEEEKELFKALREEKEEKELADLVKAFEAYFSETEPIMQEKVKEKLVVLKEDYIPKMK